MNHNKDIDDGLDEYLESSQRAQDEAAFIKNPSVFNGCLGQEGDGDVFICETVHTLHLKGGKRREENHPFSYEGGFAELSGKRRRFRMKNDPPSHFWPVTVRYRWDVDGFETLIDGAA